VEKNEYDIMFNNESHHWWYVGLHELVEYFVKNNNNKNLSIFDAGCGTGRMLSILKKYGDVKGIDYSAEAIYFCNKRGINNIKIQDLNTWDSDGELYDIIICLDVLYHSDIKNDFNMLKIFYKSLSINGLLILNLPAFNFLKRKHDLLVGGKRRYRKKYIINKIQSIGFKSILQTYRLPFLVPVILIKKFIQFIFRSSKMESDLKDINPILNKILIQFIRFENRIISKGINIPFGSSLFMISKKA